VIHNRQQAEWVSGSCAASNIKLSLCKSPIINSPSLHVSFPATREDLGVVEN
jgi:hypothetical protein